MRYGGHEVQLAIRVPITRHGNSYISCPTHKDTARCGRSSAHPAQTCHASHRSEEASAARHLARNPPRRLHLTVLSQELPVAARLHPQPPTATGPRRAEPATSASTSDAALLPHDRSRPAFEPRSSSGPTPSQTSPDRASRRTAQTLRACTRTD